VADKAGGTAQELRVSPGIITTLVFDTPLDLEAMKAELDGLAPRFELADVGMSRLTLTLRPSAGFTPGTRQRLEARFAQGEEPRRAVLELVSVSGEAAERQVEVHRKPPPPEERVAALEARGAACEAELAVVKARGAMPLALLVLEGELTPTVGIEGTLLKPKRDNHPPEGVTLTQPALYRTRERAVLSLRLYLSPGGRPWAPGELEVRDARTGRSMTVHGVAMKPPVLAPGAEALLTVEWEVSTEADGTVEVRVLERDGARHVGVKGVEPGTP
jgi:uncharacterized protein (TIGR02268 family)